MQFKIDIFWHISKIEGFDRIYFLQNANLF